MMKNDPLSYFWKEKEKKRKSVLLIASSAQYVGGYPGLAGPISGLLYIMKNGIYFENFKNEDWRRSVFRDVFHVDEDFTTIDLALLKKDIVDVFCFHGQKDKQRISLWRRIGYLVGLTPRRLYVTYRQKRCEVTIAFACDESPASLCAAYYAGNGRSSATSGGARKKREARR